jgi:hypothetical protein
LSIENSITLCILLKDLSLEPVVSQGAFNRFQMFCQSLQVSFALTLYQKFHFLTARCFHLYFLLAPVSFSKTIFLAQFFATRQFIFIELPFFYQTLPWMDIQSQNLIQDVFFSNAFSESAHLQKSLSIVCRSLLLKDLRLLVLPLNICK